MSSPASPTPIDPQPRAAADTACVGCGYIVATLPTDACCPECATPVADSLRGDALVHADPAYISSLLHGTTLVILGGFVSAAWWVAAPILMANLPTRASGEQFLPLVALAAFDFLGAVLLLIGWWLLTAVDPAVQDPARDSRRRRFLRSILLFIALTAAAGFAGATIPALSRAGLAGISGSVTINSWSQVSVLLGVALTLRVLHVVARCLRHVLGLGYLSTLLLRVPDARAARAVRRQRWLIVVWMTLGWAVLVGPLVGIVWYFLDLFRARRVFVRVLAERTGRTRSSPA
jgi:hypothetical protein